MSTAAPVHPAELRRAPVLGGLADDDLAWFAAQCGLVTLAVGDTHFEVGAPAAWRYVVLDGAVHSRREGQGPESPVFRMERGGVRFVRPAEPAESWRWCYVDEREV